MEHWDSPYLLPQVYCGPECESLMTQVSVVTPQSTARALKLSEDYVFKLLISFNYITVRPVQYTIFVK